MTGAKATEQWPGERSARTKGSAHAAKHPSAYARSVGGGTSRAARWGRVRRPHAFRPPSLINARGWPGKHFDATAWRAYVRLAAAQPPKDGHRLWGSALGGGLHDGRRRRISKGTLDSFKSLLVKSLLVHGPLQRQHLYARCVRFERRAQTSNAHARSLTPGLTPRAAAARACRYAAHLRGCQGFHTHACGRHATMRRQRRATAGLQLWAARVPQRGSAKRSCVTR